MTAFLSDYREILGTAWLLCVLVALTVRAGKDHRLAAEHDRYLSGQRADAWRRASVTFACDVCQIRTHTLHIRTLADDAAVLCEACDATMYGAQVNV